MLNKVFDAVATRINENTAHSVKNYWAGIMPWFLDSALMLPI